MLLMWIDSIQGDCQIRGYEKWITCASMSYGGSKDVEDESKGSDKGIGAKHIRTSRGNYQDLRVSKTADIATPDLMVMAMQLRSSESAKGSQRPLDVELHIVEPMQQGIGWNPKTGDKSDIACNVRIVFENIQLKEWSFDGDDEERPKEDLVFWYRVANITYFPMGYLMGQTGFQPRSKGWDAEKNAEFPVDNKPRPATA